MKGYGKHMLRKVVSLSALATAGVFVQQAAAQEPNTANNTTMYYNSQYNAGVYTNPSYDNYYISYNDFYENLAPYGQWIDDPQLGYVFSPNVDMSFRPYYTNGYWAMTDYGNTWISNYEWGWACFHYGRWTFDAYYGWLWVPGTNWGPAWVSWRYGNGYYGWAPLAPGFEFSSGAYTEYACPRDWWVFIPAQYVYTGNYYRFWYGAQGNSTIYKSSAAMDNTYVTSNITYVAGPRVKDVEAVTHQPVQLFHINNAGGPRVASAHNGVIKLFRPSEIKTTPLNGERIAPPNVIAAPRPVTGKPHAISATGGNEPAFRTDVPAASAPVTVKQMPVRTNNTPREAGRADEFPYSSDLHAHDATARPGQGHVAQKPGELPPQKAQVQDPVRFHPPQTTPLPAPAQHADPIPTVAPPPKAPSKQIPKQHPDPVTPSKQ